MTLPLNPPPAPHPPAVFSPDRRHRYRLSRGPWNDTLPTLGVVGHNPSTADEDHDDNTVIRLKDFAQLFGFGGFNLYNLSAGRATNPKHLRTMADPIGPENDSYLHELGHTHDVILLAWGTNADPQRARTVTTGLWRALRQRGGTLATLGWTAHRQPPHPLRLPRTTALVSLSVTAGQHPSQIDPRWRHLIADDTQ